MSTKLKLLAVLHIMFGGSGLVMGLVMFWVIANDPGNRNYDWMLQIILFFWGIYFLPAFAGGVGLLTGKAWARWLMVAVSCVVLIVIPIGTVLGAFGLWTLLGKEAGKTLTAPSSIASMPPPDNGALTAVLGVGCGFAVALNLGFMIHGQQTPAVLEILLLPAIIGLVITLVLGVRWIVRKRNEPKVTQRPDF